MKKKNVLAMVVIAFGVANFTTSCSSSSSSQSPDASATVTALSATASDETQSASISDNVDNEVDNYVTFSAINAYKAPALLGIESVNVPTITVDKPDSTSFPKKFTINYGTTGIIGVRGDTIKGEIIVVVSNKMTIEGSSRTMTYRNFSINGNAIAGSKVYTYNGLTGIHPSWTSNVNDTITREDGAILIWHSIRTRERMDNNGTPLIYWDDNYSITGGSNGVNAKGIAFTSVINTPLEIGGGWPFFTKGILTITTATKTVVIDYGDGTKDRKATATVNGVTHTFTIKR